MVYQTALCFFLRKDIVALRGNLAVFCCDSNYFFLHAIPWEIHLTMGCIVVWGYNRIYSQPDMGFGGFEHLHPSVYPGFLW